MKPDLDMTTWLPTDSDTSEGGDQPGSLMVDTCAPAAPPQLDRFQLERLLGQGGMGEVWQAWDPRLERRVAVKRLKVTNPATRRRFLREARLQATVVHPGICPVFEVDQDQGQPYLVMPCLDGISLAQAVEGAALEHTLSLMRQVAEAVHAAHGQGLIHRDLKPSNILVETPNDAPPRPVVLDFGIARTLGEDGMTASGDIVGTPAFMAPEQIEGHSSQLDRRTDVYALGATLYYLLANRPPHPGQGAALLLSITRDEPDRLQSLGVPAEVEAILFKCLEKEPGERYDSALALAKDLQRYLDGQPVKARPITWRVRLGKWLRRHRVAVRATAVTALLGLAALSWGIWSAWQSEERQRLARHFGAQIEEIEALARYSHMAPPHDVRPDQEKLRRRLDAIRQGLESGDALERALTHHALGRGHLALDELDAARHHLEDAHALDPDHVEIHADLGRVLSELYRERLTLLERTGDHQARDSLREQLSAKLEVTFHKAGEQQKQWQKNLGEPARDLLARVDTSQTADVVEHEALVLFHDGKPEAALAVLAEATPPAAWDYERFRLEGDIRRSWAVSLQADAETADAAKQQLDAARRAYARGLEIATSYPALLRADAQTIALLVRLDLVPLGEVDSLLEESRQRLRQAAEIHPDDFQTWLWTVRFELIAANQDIARGRDPSARLTAALSHSRHARTLEPENSALWYAIGQSHQKLARWQRQRGLNPAEHLAQATAALAKVRAQDRDYSYFTALGTLRMLVAGHQSEIGLDAGPVYASAIEAYRSAAAVHSAPFAALSNLGLALLNAAHSQGADAQNLLLQAVHIFQQTHDLRPEHMAPSYYLGLCRLRLARGGNDSNMLLDAEKTEQAQANFQRATELGPDRFQPWVGLGELFHLQALDAQARGQNPGPFLNRARQAHNRALELAPEQPTALLNLAWTVYFEGKFMLRDGDDPTALLAEADQLCQRSLALRRWPKSLLCLGSVRRLQAEYQLNTGTLDLAARALTEAEDLFEEILVLDPKHAEGHRSLGRLFTLEGRRLRLDGSDPTTALARARDALDRALELEDTAIDFQLADVRWHLEWAEWLSATGGDTRKTVAAGRRRLARALERIEVSAEAARLEDRLNDLARMFPRIDVQDR